MELSNIISDSGYPLFTKRFRNISNFYIKDGKLIKNRGDKFTTAEIEVENYNEIVIEKDGIVNIYCSKHKEEIYLKEIELLKSRYDSNIDRRIKVHTKIVI